MSTPLYQEALIEAKKLRDAAAVEAKNAVLEAVSPLIKQMIDKEISGIILEQEEPPPAPEASADAPPPPPPAPSPDAGSTGPIDAAPAAGAEVKPTMPGMTPAVSAAAPPIKSPGSEVIGKIDIGPGGEQQIVVPVDALFQKETTPASAGTTETPAGASPAPEAAASPDSSMPSATEAPPSPEATPAPAEPSPESLTEIYRAVQKLLREQAAPPAAPPATPDASAAPPATPPAAPAATPPATPDAAAPPPTGDLNVAAGAAPAPPAAPPPAAPPAVGAAPPATPPADAAAPTPPATGAAVPPVTPTPAAAGTPPAPAPVTEYKVFKQNLDRAEGLVQSLRNKQANTNVLFLKEAYEKQLFSLYNNLLGLKAKNAISPRLFSFNEDRLGLLYENLNVITSYKQNPLAKGNIMAKKNSLKDLVKALFEGAEGFEDAVGKVDPAGDSEGGSAEHAHKVSGNPKGVKAEAEKAPFPTKQKKEWPGKPSPESLLEQLEEEIGELMAEMEGEEEGMHEEAEAEDEVVLELADEEVMMEARKARTRLKALREQAEDSLSLTIDLDGVSGSSVSNVNVSLDGEELEVDMEEEGMEDAEEGEEEGEEEVEEESSEEEALQESRRIVRKAVNENKALRGQLHETQLLTARSLYVNKLFVRDELTGTQKRKIVEYLDSANTIAEAKEIYNRLVRVLDAGEKNGAMIKESAQRPARMLTESVVEPSFDTTRWQILAGVKRNAK